MISNEKALVELINQSSSLTSIMSSWLNLLSDPYQTNSTPSSVSTKPISSVPRFNPYVYPSPYPSVTVINNGPPVSSHPIILPRRVVPPTPAAAAALEIKYKNASQKELIRPLEDYGTFDPSRILPEDPSLVTQKYGKKMFWFFIASLLMDPSKKGVIAWTGRGREFIIISPSNISSLWSAAQGLVNPVKFESIRRNLRTCYKRRVMIPVDAMKNRFAFHTEPSIHLGMTCDQLTEFIANHNINACRPQENHAINAADSPLYPTPPPSSSACYDDAPPSSSTVSSPSLCLTPPPNVHFDIFESAMNQFLLNLDSSLPLPILDINDSDLSGEPYPYWSPPSQTDYQFPPQCVDYPSDNLW